jgi:hypothetical protein
MLIQQVFVSFLPTAAGLGLAKLQRKRPQLVKCGDAKRELLAFVRIKTGVTLRAPAFHNAVSLRSLPTLVPPYQ